MRTPEETEQLVALSEQFTPPEVRVGQIVCYYPQLDAPAEIAIVSKVRENNKGIALVIFQANYEQIVVAARSFVRHRADPLATGDTQGCWDHTAEYALLQRMANDATATLDRLEKFKVGILDEMKDLRIRNKTTSDRCNLLEGKLKNQSADYAETFKKLHERLAGLDGKKIGDLNTKKVA